MLPAIGSFTALNAPGRLGAGLDARPAEAPADGRQAVTLTLNTVDQRDARGQAAARVSNLGPMLAQDSERTTASRQRSVIGDARGARTLVRWLGGPTAAETEALATTLSAPDHAVARLGFRLYAAGQNLESERPRIDLTS